MQLKIKNGRKALKRPEGPHVEDFVSLGSVDDDVVKELFDRAQKRLLTLSADTKNQVAPIQTVRKLCEEIKLQAQKCLLEMQAGQQLGYKPYIEYFTRVEITGGIPRHETATSLIEYCFLNPKLPSEALKFTQTYAEYIHQAALEITYESAKAYVVEMKKLSEKMTLDPVKNNTFITVFRELYSGLSRASEAPSVSIYMHCLTNALLSLRMAFASTFNSPVQPDKLSAMLSLISRFDGIEKTSWFPNVATLLMGLDSMGSRLKVLDNYSIYKIRQNIIQESIDPQTQVSNFIN